MLGNNVTTKNHAVNAEQFDVTAQGMVTGTIFVKHFNFYFKILKQVVLPVHEKSFFSIVHQHTAKKKCYVR